MHAVFAVEPEAINNWSDFRYLIEKFGFPNGALIAKYPKRWQRLVLEACDANKVKDRERSKIVEKLSEIKHDRLISQSFPYDGKQLWLDNAIQPEVSQLFDGLVLAEKNAAENSYSIDDISEEVFQNRRETRVLRDSRSLADASRCLLVDAQEVILIDPYLRPKRSCTNLLNAFVDLALEKGNGVKKLVIHMAYSQDPRERQDVIADYLRYMREKVADGLTIQVVRWNDDALDFDFHARYLITDKKVGLRYDRGFVEPSDHDARRHQTDVVCMERATVNGLLDQYQTITEAALIFDVIDIQ